MMFGIESTIEFIVVRNEDLESDLDLAKEYHAFLPCTSEGASERTYEPSPERMGLYRGGLLSNTSELDATVGMPLGV
eukprot:COSAG05_NODE_985_length_6290_cov_2.922953_3_plen_77_part_00